MVILGVLLWLLFVLFYVVLSVVCCRGCYMVATEVIYSFGWSSVLMVSHLLRKAEIFRFIELASQKVSYSFCGAFSKKLCQWDFCKLKSLLPLKFRKCVALITLELSIFRFQANGLFVG